MDIGLLIIATNKYDTYINPFLESANRYFLKGHKVTYFIFTDTSRDLKQEYIFEPTREYKINQYYKKHEPWPYPTLNRYHTFLSQKEDLLNQDYLFYADVDMLFLDNIEDEILSDRVATIHPGFPLGATTVESNQDSTAYIPQGENPCYFAGGFNGGTSAEFIQMSKTISENIDKDSQKNIIAMWHDESHLNRFLVDNPPTKILHPGYCYPDPKSEFPQYQWLKDQPKKLMALAKDHEKMRG